MIIATTVLVLHALSPSSPAWTVDHSAPYESVTESERLYHEDRARTITGVITDTRTVTLKDGVPFLQMDLKTEEGPILVHLAPVWFMEERANLFDVDKGRAVTVLGAASEVQGQSVFVAAELSNADRQQHVRLRHPSGVPAWVGSERVR
jgi:hypothetical protein